MIYANFKTKKITFYIDYIRIEAVPGGAARMAMSKLDLDSIDKVTDGTGEHRHERRESTGEAVIRLHREQTKRNKKEPREAAL